MAGNAKTKVKSGATNKRSAPERRPQRQKLKPGSKATAKRTRSEPSRPTVKGLFAVSGNTCAFPRCKSALVDPETHSILGEICHIMGENPGSARYDPEQSSKERQSFKNLILMCGQHHKLIDDNPDKYPSDRLKDMKGKHESGRTEVAKLSDAQADRMIANIRNNTVTQGSILQTQGQRGGQVAHSIHNTKVYNRPKVDDKVRITGGLSTHGELEVLRRFGCPGLELKVVCKSKRQAKIRGAHVCVEGRGFIEALQQGFATDFGHKPPKGRESETLFINLINLSTPNSSEGFTLNRDDVCRFFLPMCLNSLMPFLTASPANVFIRVLFFDGSKRTLLRGKEVQETLRALVRTHQTAGHELKVPLSMGVDVSSTEMPSNLPVGMTNPNPVTFVKREQAEKEVPPSLDFHGNLLT